MSMVRHEQGKLPSISAKRRAELQTLAQEPDATISYGDIPPTTPAMLRQAIQNPFYRPNKLHTTVRVDADVLAWLKAQGRGYQTRLNAILRRAMLDDLQKV